jgi:hypothetical protein
LGREDEEEEEEEEEEDEEVEAKPSRGPGKSMCHLAIDSRISRSMA